MNLTFIRACTVVFVVLLAAWTHATNAAGPHGAVDGGAAPGAWPTVSPLARPPRG